VKHPLNLLAVRVAQFGTGVPRRTSELSNKYSIVIRCLETLPEMTVLSSETEAEMPGWERHYETYNFDLPYLVGDLGNGKVTFQADSILESFKEALEDAEISRIQRCPILECRKFYYAARQNTGACAEHLARARVERARDSEKRRQYRENQKKNRKEKTRRKSGTWLEEFKASRPGGKRK
jgi:hypothetical protein